MTDEFPKWTLGTIYGSEGEYEVHWLEKDLVRITQEGDEIFTLASKHAPGFLSTEDAMDQAQDAVLDLEEGLDWDLPDYGEDYDG